MSSPSLNSFLSFPKNILSPPPLFLSHSTPSQQTCTLKMNHSFCNNVFSNNNNNSGNNHEIQNNNSNIISTTNTLNIPPAFIGATSSDRPTFIVAISAHPNNPQQFSVGPNAPSILGSSTNNASSTNHNTYRRNHVRLPSTRDPPNTDRQNSSTGTPREPSQETYTDERDSTENRTNGLRLVQPTTVGTATETGTVLSGVHEQSIPLQSMSSSSSDDRAQYTDESSFGALYRRLSARIIGDRLLQRTLNALNDRVSGLLFHFMTSIRESIPVESMFDFETHQGATDLQLSQLPSFTLKEWSEDIPRTCVGGGTCVICMDQYSPDATLTRLRCGHVFHNDCICTWFRIQSSCPMCREQL